jgi:putative selenate reductase molybdopterin-binding subunit
VSLRLATGQAAYAGDHSPSGLLHVALRSSPSAHARVASANAAAARRLPGVVAVLTCDDAPALLPRVVRFVGDRLAIVAAVDPETARRGAELVELELEEREPRLEADETADDSAVVARLDLAEGDVDQALAGADHSVAGEWRLPFAPTVPLEPPTAISWLDEGQRLVVRTSADSPFLVRGELAARLGIPAARVRVVRPAASGGGVRRGVLVEDACAGVTLATGRPARLSLTAAEALAFAPARPAERVRLRLALRGAEIVALEARLVVDVGAGHEHVQDLLRASARQALGLYRVPHVRVSAVAVRTHRPPTFTGRGADGLAFALESAIDEAALALGVDPAALRRAHLRLPGRGHRPAETADPSADPSADADAGPLGEMLRRLEQKPAPVPRDDSSARRVGRGLAAARCAEVAAGPAAAATIRLLEDGSFALTAGPTSLSLPDEPLYAQAAAAMLGVPARRIVCAVADTDTAPYLETGDAAPGSALARAVEQAAARMADEIRRAGARLLGVPAETLQVRDGRVSGNGRGATFADVGAAAMRLGAPLTVTAAPTAQQTPQSLAAAAADVAFDAETGEVEVLGLHAVVASGPYLEPQHAAGRVEGALVSAIERVLAAGIEPDAPAGRGWPRSLPLCTALDVPPLSVSFTEGGDAHSHFDAELSAQAAGRAAQAALANAVARASALRLRSLPLHPARLLAALGEQDSPR